MPLNIIGTYWRATSQVASSMPYQRMLSLYPRVLIIAAIQTAWSRAPPIVA